MTTVKLQGGRGILRERGTLPTYGKAMTVYCIFHTFFCHEPDWGFTHSYREESNNPNIQII